MGVAYYGLRSGSGGEVIPTVLNTSAVQGTLSLSSTGIQPLYLYDSSPDFFASQLNSVTTNISLFGTAGYQFWTQNVIEYGYQSHQLFLITNVWNFSSPASYLSPNVFFAHGPDGTQVGASYYYAELGPISVSYPFNVTFTMTSTLSAGRDAIDFSTVIQTPTRTIPYRDWDFVVFNSTAPGGTPLSVASPYTADGYHYNPVGLTNDFELMVGGPGGGSQADIMDAQTTMDLSYWNATTGGFQSVPAAVNAAGETGETATGVTESWRQTPTGPVADLATGPSILGGLWNASQPAGAGLVTINVRPGNAFLFFAPANTTNFTASFPPEWAPNIDTNTFNLAVSSPEDAAYVLTVGLSGFTPQTLFVSVSAVAQSVTVTLARNNTIGIYTPLWAWNNSVAQLSAISSGGRGTPQSPWQIQNVQTSEISFLFGIVNDYTFPVYSGVFLIGTTVPVTIYHAAPMVVESPYFALPATNYLPYALYGASNVSIVSSTIGPTWWTAYPIYVPYYTTADIVLWNSTFDLIGNDTIDYTFTGVYLYGGGNNTLWGNTWNPTLPPPGPSAILLETPFLALEDGESGDLIYDNAFTNLAQVPDLVTAYTPNFDLYTGAAANYTDTWNISEQLASTVHYPLGFFPTNPLYGNILGYSTQGGNYWYDYDPTTPLPYDAFGYITNGGDSVPYVANVTVMANPATVPSARQIVVFRVGGHLLDGLGTLSLSTSTGTVLATMPVPIHAGMGSISLVPGLLLPVGESTLEYWVVVPGWGLVSTVGVLTFYNAEPPTFLTLSDVGEPFGLVVFSIGSDAVNVAVTLYGETATGVMVAAFPVPLGPIGSGSIVLLPAYFGLVTYWWAEYGTITSNLVTVGAPGLG